MAVILVDNAFNLRINLGLIDELTGISECHCFTDYSSAYRYLNRHLEKVKVVFLNPNLANKGLLPLMDILKGSAEKEKMKVRILYKPVRSEELVNYEVLKFTGMPITRNEIDLLKTL